MLLLITHKEGYIVDFVVNQLNAAAIPYFKLNCEDLLEYRYRVSFSAGKPLALKGTERFTAGWFRRVKKLVLTLAEAHVAKYVAGELLALLQNLYLLLDGKWVSQPMSTKPKTSFINLSGRRS
jgi:hypothetical protein